MWGAGELQVRLIPWAGASAADCTAVLQRRVRLGALASTQLLRIQLDDLLQGTAGMQAAGSHGFFLQASFTPEPAATCPGACGLAGFYWSPGLQAPMRAP